MTKILFAVKARKRSFGVLMTLVLLASSLTILVQFREAKAASIVWTGATNNNWSTGSNWVGGVAPGLSDIAVFNSTYNVAATVDASISVAGISVTAGYTQTITQAAVMTIGASGFIQADGTFTGATQTIDINGPLTISAGIFTATSGETQVQGNMTVSAGVTFNHNSGQFEFNGSTDTTLDVDTTLTMNNFETNKSSATVGIAIASGDTIVLAGTLYLTNGELNGPSGKIQTPGTVTRTGGDGGDGIINMTGAAAQTLTLGTAVAMPGVTIDNPNVAISLTGGFEGVVTLNAGTITGVTSIRFSESLIIDGGTFVAPAITYFNKDWTYTSGTFTHSDGTVYIDDDGTANDHVISGTPTFYNLKIFQSNKLANVQFAAGSTTTILNEATFGMSYFTGMDEDSRISLSSDSAGSAASIDFQGRVNMFHVDIQDITNTGSSFYCYVRCEDSGGNTGIDFSPMSVVYVSEISGETTEAGGTATFTVVLAGRPSSNVTIPLISSDTGEGTASSASLTFTNANWSTPQTVTVTGQDDLVDDGTISYTIQLAITASSDSRFSGLNPDDVTVKNQDDDIGDDSVQFDYLANFDDEEVAGTTGTNVGAFWSGGNGLGWIYDNDTAWTEIDVLASKIKPGCLMTVEGEQYIISQLVDEGDYGYDVILSKNNPNSEAIGATLDALADNDVESITCLESEGGGIKLNDGFLNTEAINMQFSYDMLYDSVNDQIVAGIYNTTNLQLVDVTAVTSSNVTIGSDPRGVAYDSLRDVLWVTNYDDDTVTAVNASDGSYAFTTLGASTFSVGNAPWRIAYDNVNDKLWVTHAIGNDLLQVDPSDGSTTATLAMGDEMTDVVYDSTNDSVWVLSVANVLIEIDGSTAAYKAGTLAASSYDVSVQGTNLDNLVYDST
ncbi:hypothetical protein KJ758_02760, partial [Patescibacteria group bacterium]|nr:hypothetical protein [Patescibacteria group bacterium]